MGDKSVDGAYALGRPEDSARYCGDWARDRDLGDHEHGRDLGLTAIFRKYA